MAPQVDYLIKMFKPFTEKYFGIKFDIEIIQRGFYPKGNGLVKLKTQPVHSLMPFTLEERGEIISFHTFIYYSGNIPEHVVTRMLETAEKLLKKSFDTPDIKYTQEIIKETKQTAFGDGTGILIYAESSHGCVLCGSCVGELGKTAETVATEAANQLIKDINDGGCVDEFLQDQIIIFMGLADGISKIKVGVLSQHTLTSIHFTELMTGAKFTVIKCPTQDNTHYIECSGIGFKNHFKT